jgi:competence protein ComEC
MRPASGRIHLTLPGEVDPGIARGARVRLAARPRPVGYHANPGAPARPRRPDVFSAFVDDPGAIAVLARPEATLMGHLDTARATYAAFWERSLEERPARLARALSLGEASVLSPGDRDVFRRTGTAHLLAVSGLHLGLVVLLAFGLLRWLLLRLGPLAARLDVGRLAAAAAIPPVIAFTLLVGARPPVVRACIMACSFLLARALGRRAGPAESLSLAAAAMLAFDPLDLQTAGFQLSFSAVLGFLLTVERRRGTDGERTPSRGALHRARRQIWRWLRGSLAATAATTPLVLYHFGSFCPISVPMNTVAVPIVTVVVMPALLVTMLISPALGDAASILAAPVGGLLDLLARFLDLVAGLPWSATSPGPVAAAGVCVLCLAALLLLNGRLRLFAASGVLGSALLAISILADPDRFPDGALVADILDVGQGESILLTFPDGRRWLVDAGGTAASDIGRDHIVPVLRGMGVGRLDALVLTHPDPDHVEGMAAVLAAIGAQAVWDNGQGAAEGADGSYELLMSAARASSTPILRTGALCGSRTIAGVKVEVLHPCHTDGDYDPGLSLNDNSIVLHLSYQGAAMLLTGDLSRDGEEIMLERGVVPRVDLLKLGHHGSRTSTGAGFLRRAGPRFAVASCGAWNSHGMPHREVLSSLRGAGVRLLRTDLHGAIRAVLRDGDVRLSFARGSPAF